MRECSGKKISATIKFMKFLGIDPGFDRLVAWLCAGDVGAVLCFDASRLARSGRGSHHLLARSPSDGRGKWS